jgi:hypothetical protein
MISIRSSILTNFTASSITFSTLIGSTISSVPLIIASTVNTSTLISRFINYSTITGSTINTSNATISTLQTSTLRQLQQLSTITSTIRVGSVFNLTNGANKGTVSTISNYNADITDIARTAALQAYDNSVAITAQPSLDYNLFGQNWTVINSVPTGTYIGCSMSANGQYQIACIYSSGGIYYSSNYGQTWALAASTSTISWVACSMSSSGQYCIAGGGVYDNSSTTPIYISSNYGQTWTSTGQSITYQTRCAISGSGQYMFAAGGAGGGSSPIYLSSNYGTTWTTVGPTLTWLSCAMSASGQYMYAGTNVTNNVYISSNYGQTWTPVTVDVSAIYAYAIACSASGQYLCTVDITNYVYYSSNYGVSWTRSTSTTTGVGGIAMSASGQYVISGGLNSTYSMYYSSNYGQTWTIVPSSPTGNWYGVAMSANGQYLLAANITASSYLQQSITPFYNMATSGNITANTLQTAVLSYSDGSTVISAQSLLDYSTFGSTWTQTSSASANWCSPAISGTGQYQINAIYGGAIYYSSNYGQTWTIATSSPTGNWGTAAISNNGKYAVICPIGNGYFTPGLAYYSSTYGQTWTSTAISVNGYVGISLSGQYMCISNYWNGTVGVYVSSNYGLTWTRTNTNAIYVLCMSGTGQYLYGAPYASGSAYMSSDYGQTWRVMSGITPSSVNPQAMSTSASGRYISIAGNVTGFYYSSNYGLTFTKSASATSSQCMSMSMTSSGQYQIAQQLGSTTVYSSKDYGVTWSTTTGINNIVFIAMSPNGQYIMGGIGNGSGGATGSIYISVTSNPPSYTSGTLYATGQYSASNPGYTTLPGGIIMQFGNGTSAAPVVNGESTTAVTFPKAFTTQCYAVTVAVSDLSTSALDYIEYFAAAGSYTLSSFTLSLKTVYSSFTFTPMGATGRLGPTSLTYSASTYPWGTLSTSIILGNGSNGAPAGIQRFVVPYTATYVLTAAGAQGGNGTYTGGSGVIVSNTVSLTAGDILFILVGQKGPNGTSQGGGGGGTFICKYNGGAFTSTGSYVIQLIAGGGGGAGNRGNGANAVTTTTGGVNTATVWRPTEATGGAGGNRYTSGGVFAGAGGGGFSGDGIITYVAGTSQGTPGAAFINGGTGGQDRSDWTNLQGGFGGGAGTNSTNENWGVGGGGGYSGGGGASVSQQVWVWADYGAGGGGSYDINGSSNNATLSTALGSSGYNTGDGYVIVRLANRSTAPVTYYYVAYGK